jgi:hypothetical protein
MVQRSRQTCCLVSHDLTGLRHVTCTPRTSTKELAISVPRPLVVDGTDIKQVCPTFVTKFQKAVQPTHDWTIFVTAAITKQTLLISVDHSCPSNKKTVCQCRTFCSSVYIHREICFGIRFKNFAYMLQLLNFILLLLSLLINK